VRVLVVTNMYPTAKTPNAGPFVATQVESLRKLGLDMTVLHLPRHDVGRRVYRNLAARVRGSVGENDPDLVHVAYGGVMAASVTSAIKDRPVLVTFHGSDVLGGRGSTLASTMSRRVGVAASRRAARRAAGIIAVSENVITALPSGIDRSRVWLVPNGVDIERFRPLDKPACRKELRWDEGRHVLFPASPARYEKRFDLAQATVGRLQDEGMAVELHALDGVPHEDVPVWLNASDAILLTSDHEGSPVVVKEALACNVPVVSVDVGDVRARIADIDGCEIAEATAEDLSRSLRVTLERNRPIDGRTRIADLSLERTAERIKEIYTVLTTSRQAAQG
jgi:glycosyltransferase involved in cell wall biosynthesis